MQLHPPDSFGLVLFLSISMNVSLIAFWIFVVPVCSLVVVVDNLDVDVDDNIDSNFG
jgi:hypothetical protein